MNEIWSCRRGLFINYIRFGVCSRRRAHCTPGATQRLHLNDRSSRPETSQLSSIASGGGRVHYRGNRGSTPPIFSNVSSKFSYTYVSRWIPRVCYRLFLNHIYCDEAVVFAVMRRHHCTGTPIARTGGLLCCRCLFVPVPEGKTKRWDCPCRRLRAGELSWFWAVSLMTACIIWCNESISRRRFQPVDRVFLFSKSTKSGFPFMFSLSGICVLWSVERWCRGPSPLRCTLAKKRQGGTRQFKLQPCKAVVFVWQFYDLKTANSFENAIVSGNQGDLSVVEARESRGG